MSASPSISRRRPLPLLAGAAALLFAAGAARAGSAPLPPRPAALAEATRLYARYRSTLSHEDLAAADAAVQAGLDAAPGDYDLRKFRLRLLLPHHDFEGLRREAEALRKERPGDAELDGALGDADFDLGNYPEAFAAYERFAARQPSTASYSRIALAREIAGDLRGALQSMDLAADSARATDAEGFAWCRARSARILLKLNRYDEAEGRLVEALRRVPDHAPSLAAAAEIAARKGLWEPAARLAERAFALEPEAGVAAALVDYRRAMADAAGEARAKKALADFDARLPEDHRLVHRPLALYFSDHGEPARGLAMAERELKGRKDVYGWDAYAWTLYRAGRPADAVEPMKKALALGTVDPLLEFHAGAIARAAGDTAGAKRHLERALKLDPRFHVLYADEARRMLGSATPAAASLRGALSAQQSRR
jgi:tetratricopeptide (TPR) repeat protein